MNEYIKEYIKCSYGIDADNCTKEDLMKVTEIRVSDVTGVGRHYEKYVWDFSAFPNLKYLDCSYNYIDTINVSNNLLLEEIYWHGVRGRFSQPIDLSNNTHLRKISGGQDGLAELDLSNNTELEQISMNYCFLRWINLSNCSRLKRIIMVGANIPFVDLTHCSCIEYCDINYMNLYRNKCDVYGDGYPRPFIFVRDDFDERVIPSDTRSYSYFAYYLLRTMPNSAESRLLEYLKSKKSEITSIAQSPYGHQIAELHYQILDILEGFRNQWVK